jgi:hypothetical protein
VPAPVPQPLPVAPPEPATHGYFVGAISLGASGYYGEALLTVDGLVRIYIGGPWDPIAASRGRQFIGRLEFLAGEAHGTGFLLEQECSSAAPCEPEPAEITIATATRSELSGAIATANGNEVWSFDMSWPTFTYLEPATLELAAGQYSEQLATFALGAVMNVYGDGRFFFQSPSSGCIGNGVLTPHLDGTSNVYDATLLVENCTDEGSNGELEGLATRTIGGGWDDWGDWLILWLSTPQGAQAPQALVMWGSRIP